jgi:murein DD-endopeptidase MepM/ murein hydrolase activator NlpD
MNERYHIIVTGEDGRSSAFQLSKRKFRLTIGTAVTCVIAVCVFGYLTTGSYFSNKLLTRKVDDLQIRLSTNETAGYDYRKQIDTLKQQYTEQIDTLKQQYTDKIAAIQQEHSTLIATIQEDHATLITDQQAKFDLENTSLQLENVRLMNTAVSDLNERSQLIESVMDKIGVELKNGKKSSPSANSGGPFIPAEELSYDELMKKTEENLKTIRLIPLGRPVPGSISSKFGKRADPLNKKKAVHEGVDIRGKKGERIQATASGKVIKAFKNGSYGNYVKIDHGNGYHTIYAHMQNYLVNKGETIEQGHVVGQVGSSGRSTGPHLHYEILLNNRPINPVRFMKIADLSHTFTKSQE